MRYITERPYNYDSLNHLDLRSDFENEEEEPLIFTYLVASGYVGNRPNDFEGDFHEDDTWAIDQWDEDKEVLYQSFLYSSEFEYKQDCEILNLQESTNLTKI